MVGDSVGVAGDVVGTGGIGVDVERRQQIARTKEVTRRKGYSSRERAPETEWSELVSNKRGRKEGEGCTLDVLQHVMPRCMGVERRGERKGKGLNTPLKQRINTHVQKYIHN